jgi:hypothetical protein
MLLMLSTIFLIFIYCVLHLQDFYLACFYDFCIFAEFLIHVINYLSSLIVVFLFVFFYISLDFLKIIFNFSSGHLLIFFGGY